jgi:hypothetical protein
MPRDEPRALNETKKNGVPLRRESSTPKGWKLFYFLYYSDRLSNEKALELIG